MQIFVWSFIIVISVVLDQITKSIAVTNLKPVGFYPFIDNIIGFRYVENTGAAFGMGKGFRWGFIILSAIAIAAILFLLIKNRKSCPTLLGVSMTMIVGGGIGNQIDRIANGFVVDFLEFQFVEFAVFNVADCFVTVGACLAIIDIVFFHRNYFFGDSEPKPVQPDTENGDSHD